MEIKLRAWNKKTKQMYYNIGIVPDYVITEYEGYTDNWNFCTRKDCEVMLGITSNEVDVYDGDIIRIGYNYDSDIFSQDYLISFDFEFGSFLASELPDDDKSTTEYLSNIFDYKEIQKVEVIGNIYENPELIPEQ